MTGAEVMLWPGRDSGYGYGDKFVHRTGHGLGLEIHEEPYIVASNDGPCLWGSAHRTWIYIPGKGGVRIEDDVVLTVSGAKSNRYPRNLLNM